MAAPSRSLPLDDTRADLWFVRPEDCADPGLLDEYRGLLDEGELDQLHRFRVEKKKHEHLVSRALVRTVLSHYAPADPRQWAFDRNPHGKPSVAFEPGCSGPPLKFNLSHTDGLVVCLVARGCEVGVDVEDGSRAADFLGLARRFFATAEAAVVESLPDAERPAAFYRFWTLKEAYIKARGLGLSIPLASFAFTLRDDQPPHIAVADPGDDDPARWQFRELRFGQRHQVAVALRRPREWPLDMVVRATIPLRTVGGPSSSGNALEVAPI